MGIVAHCPNGHRIKVKDHFARKKVLCPHCGARFRVAAADSTASPAAGLPVARVVPLDPSVMATLPRAFALDDVSRHRPHPTEQPAPIVGRSLTEELIGQATPPSLMPPTLPIPSTLLPMPEPPRAWHPLIAEQPLASWSLAQPGGEPSLPMTAADMQLWLESRQATGAELVWRSDWTDWLPIGTVFPEYVPPAAV